MSLDLGTLLLAGWRFQIELDAGSGPLEVFDIKGGDGGYGGLSSLPVDTPRYLRIRARHRHFHEGGATFGLDYALPAHLLAAWPVGVVVQGLDACWKVVTTKIGDICPDLLQVPEVP